jgi:hypothetical protein
MKSNTGAFLIAALFGAALMGLSTCSKSANLTVVNPGCATYTIAGDVVTCVSSPTPPIPPIPPVTSCTGFPNVLATTATWGQAQSWQSSQFGAFGSGATTVWLFTLKVPVGTPTSTVIGRFAISEFQGPTTFRQMTISLTPCDFRKVDYKGANGPLAVSNGTTATISYGVTTPTPVGPAGLTAGQTYYVSARNWQLDPTPQNSCQAASCNAIMNVVPAAP